MKGIEILCPSLGRADTISKQTLSLLPNELKIVVRADQRQEYLTKTGLDEDRIISCPERGLCKTMHWCKETIKADTIVFVDDDKVGVWNMIGQRSRHYTEEEDILQIIENASECSKDLGVSMFFWNQTPNPMHYNCYDPFSFFRNAMPNGVYGLHGNTLQYDTRLQTREDLDLVMQAMLKERHYYMDLRFCWDNANTVGTGAGGLQGIRTTQVEEASTKLLKEKWGRYLTLGVRNHHMVRAVGVKINIQRRNPLALRHSGKEA